MDLKRIDADQIVASVQRAADEEVAMVDDRVPPHESITAWIEWQNARGRRQPVVLLEWIRTTPLRDRVLAVLSSEYAMDGDRVCDYVGVSREDGRQRATDEVDAILRGLVAQGIARVWPHPFSRLSNDRGCDLFALVRGA